MRRLKALTFSLLLTTTAVVQAQDPAPGDPLRGTGAIHRSLLTDDILLSGPAPGGPVSESAFAVPLNAAPAVHTFEGRLELHGESASRNFRVERDLADLTRGDHVRHLPEIDLAFVQHGSYLIPAQRGLIITEHSHWNLLVEPGRVWHENGDGPYSRAAVPFALQHINNNCLINGTLSFLFNDQAVSKAWYQITLETCQYFQVDFWGLLDATYHRQSVPSPNRLRRDFLKEMQGRFPRRPIESLAIDHPGVDIRALTRDLTQSHVSTYGLVVDGVHYAGPCRSRYGEYAFCDSLRMPSYSTAKSALAGVALMRLAQKYGLSVKDELIRRWVPETAAAAGDWSAVTFENALDMATGNYHATAAFDDENSSSIDTMHGKSFYAEKLAAAFDAPGRAAPGARWVYRSSDTFILTQAMQAYLRSREGPDADLFEMLVHEVYKPIGLSPGTHTTLRTAERGWRGEPHGYHGMFWIQDDIAKLTTFLNVDSGRVGGEQILHAGLLAEALQRDPNNRGLPTHTEWGLYNHSFFAPRYTSQDTAVDLGTFYSPYMSGFGGISLVILPRGMSYYYFSDNHEYPVRRAVIAIMNALGGDANRRPPSTLEMPALATPSGAFEAIEPLAINNRGQIIGRAWPDQAPPGNGLAERSKAVRFTPHVGLENLHPRDHGDSRALAINASGDVFGITLDPDTGLQDGVFVYRQGSGFDFLNRGSQAAVRQTFEVGGFNNAGDLVGTLDVQRSPGRAAYLYNSEDGWTALDALDPRFRQRATLASTVNQRGEILFTTEPRPSGAQDTFVLLGGDRLVRLGNFGRRVNVPVGLNNSGAVAGFSETADRARHAYVFTPGKGLTDLHRGRFAGSKAVGLTSQGVVGGVFLNPAPEAIFLYDAGATPKVRVVARRADFVALLGDDVDFDHIEVVDMNERSEFIGWAEGRRGDTVVRRYFLCGAAGVVDLQERMISARSVRTITSVVDINDHGAVLVGIRKGERGGAVVLFP